MGVTGSSSSGSASLGRRLIWEEEERKPRLREKNSSRGGASRWEEEVPPLIHLFEEGMTDER